RRSSAISAWVTVGASLRHATHFSCVRVSIFLSPGESAPRQRLLLGSEYCSAWRSRPCFLRSELVPRRGPGSMPRAGSVVRYGPSAFLASANRFWCSSRPRTSGGSSFVIGPTEPETIVALALGLGQARGSSGSCKVTVSSLEAEFFNARAEPGVGGGG